MKRGAGNRASRSTGSVRALALFSVLGLIVAACGDDDSESTTTDRGTSPVAETATPNDTTAPDDTAAPDTTGDAAPATDAPPPATDGDAASAEWESIVAAAADEPTLMIYTAKTEDVMDPLISAFNEQYPDIDVEYLRMGSADSVQRIDAEMSAGRLDASAVWNTEEVWQSGLVENGAVAAPSGPALEAWPSDGLIAGASVPLSLDIGVIAYRTDAFTEPPTSWCMLPDVEDKGIGIVEPAVSNIAAFWYVVAEECGGAEWLDRLGERQLFFQTSAVPLMESLAAGEIVITPNTYPWLVQSYQDAGAPIEWSQVTEPTLMPKYIMSVLAEGPAVNSGLVFLDFAMTQQGQELINKSDIVPAASLLEGAGAYSLDGVDGFSSVDFTPEQLEESRQLFAEHVAR